MRAFASNQLIQLANNFPADGLGPEDHTGDRGGDEQYWRDREQRVVGKGRAEARCIVIPPGPECGPEYFGITGERMTSNLRVLRSPVPSSRRNVPWRAWAERTSHSRKI